MFQALTPPTGRMRLLLWCCLLGAVVFTSVRSIRKAYRGNDFGAYHAAAHAVLDDTNVYETRGSIERRNYLYPPTLAVLAIPFTVFSEPIGGIVWFLLNIVTLFWIIWIFVRRGRGAVGEPLAWIALALFALLSCIDNNNVNGQANLLVLAVILLAWRAADRERWFLSGVAIGLAACLKVTPLIFCAYFLFRRSQAALWGVAVGVVGFALVLPAIFMGPSDAWDANREWVTLVASREAASEHGDPNIWGHDYQGDQGHFQVGYSLRPFLYRWLTDSRIKHDVHAYLNVFNMDHAAVEWIFRLLAVGLLAVAFLVGLRVPGSATDRFREFAIVTATMVLISPLSRKAHFVALLPAALWLARTWWQTRDRRLLMAASTCALLFNVAMYSGSASIKMYTLGAGFYFLGGLALWLAVVFTPPPARAAE